MKATTDQERGIGRAAAAEHREVDALIVGGGVAGLWLTNLLSAKGYGVVLLEAEALGARQTLASQGMIHGGLKYALGGTITAASEAIADMPARWARCLAGEGEVDLSRLRLLSDRYYMFAAASTLGRLTSFFAGRALRGRIERLARSDYPPALASFDGVVYALNDFVIDTTTLLETLRAPVADRVYRHRLHATDVELDAVGCRVRAGGDNLIEARRLILCAGAGTGPLLQGLGIEEPQMQLRPLHQVMVHHDFPHPLYAHCLTGIRRPEPRLTITSHADGDGWLWYLGGQLATDGVTMSADALVAHARRELEACVPWVSWQEARFRTLRIDRAEPAQQGGRRPDEAFVHAAGPCIVAWPTKLSLAPHLGDRVLNLLDPPVVGAAPALALPHATVGGVPWRA